MEEESNPVFETNLQLTTIDEAERSMSTATPDHLTITEANFEIDREDNRTYLKVEQKKPTTAGIWFWYLYELCSYFVHTFLVPIVFSLLPA